MIGAHDIISDVVIGFNKDLDSSSVLNLVNDIDIGYVINAVDLVNDLIAEVGISHFVDALSDVIIKAKGISDNLGSVTTLQLADMVSEVMIPYSHDLESSTSINEYNFLNVAYFLNFIERHLELLSEAGITYFIDCLSEASIRAKAGVDLDSDANVFLHKTIETHSYIPYSNYLESSANINEFSFLNIIYDLLQAPIYHINCSDIQDTYVREARPTLNFGGSLSLIAGKALEGRYRCSLEFPIQAYLDLKDNTAAKIVKTDLVINSFSSISNTVKIQIYEHLPIWNEMTLTWSNANFSPNNLIAEFYPSTTGEIRIDISEYLNYKYALGSNRASMFFKIADESQSYLFQFYSKESTDKKPYIDLMYQEADWSAYTDEEDLTSEISIRAMNSRDVYSTVTTRQKQWDDLSTDIIIRQVGSSNLDQDISIRRSNIEEIISEALLLQKEDLSIDTILRLTRDTNLDADALIIYINEVLSDVYITAFSSWLDGSFIPRLTRTMDIDSDAVINNVFDQLSDVLIKYKGNKDQNSTTVVRLKNEEDIEASVDIRTHGDLYSTVVSRLTTTNDLLSESIFRLSGFNEIDNEVFIKNKVDLLSEITTRRSGIEEINSNLFILLKDEINSDVFVNAHQLRLDSEVNIRRQFITDLSADVFTLPNVNINSDVVIKQLQRIDLDQDALLKQIADILVDANIYYANDIIVSSILRQSGISNIDVDAIIRQFDIDELNSSLYVYGMYNTTMESEVTINVGESFNTASNATINSTARRWIPNIHSPSVFMFGDRKLPRKWVGS